MTKIEVLGTDARNASGCMPTSRRRQVPGEAEVFAADSLDGSIERGVMSTPALYIDGTLRSRAARDCGRTFLNAEGETMTRYHPHVR